jgi:hypothetical protein
MTTELKWLIYTALLAGSLWRNWCIKGAQNWVLQAKIWTVRHTRGLASRRSATRVLDPRFASTIRSCDIGRVQTRIVSCVSDGQVRCRPK